MPCRKLVAYILHTVFLFEDSSSESICNSHIGSVEYAVIGINLPEGFIRELYMWSFAFNEKVCSTTFAIYDNICALMLFVNEHKLFYVYL